MILVLNGSESSFTILGKAEGSMPYSAKDFIDGMHKGWISYCLGYWTGRNPEGFGAYVGGKIMVKLMVLVVMLVEILKLVMFGENLKVIVVIHVRNLKVMMIKQVENLNFILFILFVGIKVENLNISLLVVLVVM